MPEIWKENPYILEHMRQAAETQVIKSDLEFLNDHVGLRPKKLHTFIGPPGGGKSTLTRTILADCAIQGYRVGIYLSEETVDDFLIEVGYMQKFLQASVKNLFPISEKDLNDPNPDNVELFIRKHIQENKLQILLLDNITTMRCYELFDNQSTMVDTLRGIAIEFDIPIIILAHTGAQIKESYSGLTDMNDVRGSKTIVNESQFVYIIQPVYVGEQRFTFLRTAKARGSSISHALYQLDYCDKRRVFNHIIRKDFEIFKQTFNERNKL